MYYIEMLIVISKLIKRIIKWQDIFIADCRWRKTWCVFVWFLTEVHQCSFSPISGTIWQHNWEQFPVSPVWCIRQYRSRRASGCKLLLSHPTFSSKILVHQLPFFAFYTPMWHLFALSFSYSDTRKSFHASNTFWCSTENALAESVNGCRLSCSKTIILFVLRTRNILPYVA